MKRSLSIALLSASLVTGTAIAPAASALAAPAPSVAYDIATTRSSGPYDGQDAYRDEAGRPLPGWQNLFFSIAA